MQDISLSFDDREREIHLVLNNVNGRLTADGRNVSAEIEANVTDSNRQRVIGDLDATVRIRLDSDQKVSRARWHIKTGELMLAELVRQLPPHPLVAVVAKLHVRHQE